MRRPQQENGTIAKAFAQELSNPEDRTSDRDARPSANLYRHRLSHRLTEAPLEGAGCPQQPHRCVGYISLVNFFFIFFAIGVSLSTLIYAYVRVRNTPN